MSVIPMFLLTFIYSIFAFANCGPDCPLMSQVQLTEKGTARLFEVILKGTFDSIEKKVKDVAAFEDQQLDLSKCPKIKVYEVFTKKPKCFGVLDFRKYSHTLPDANTELVPAKLNLEKMSLQKLGIELVTPITYENGKYQMVVQAKQLKIAGKFKGHYTDTNEPIFPEADITLNASPNAKLFYKISIAVDPETQKMTTETTAVNAETMGTLQNDFGSDLLREGTSVADAKAVETFNKTSDINRVAKIVPKSSQVKLEPGQLGFTLGFPNTGSTQSKETVFKTYYDDYLKLLNDPEWIIKEYNNKRNNPFRFKGTPKIDEKEVIERVQKASSEWAEKNSKFDMNSAFRNMPEDLINLVDSASDQVYFAETKFQSTKKGFKDFSAYSTLHNMEKFANAALDHKETLTDIIAPLITNEIGPIIEAFVQDTLVNSNLYWDMISKIPLGSDPLTMNTEFVIEEFDRINHVLKLNLYDTNSDCVVPKNRQPAADKTTMPPEDFDMATSIPANSLNRILQKAFVEKKLTDCNLVNKVAKTKCKEGYLFTLNKPPQVTCDENGDLILNLPDNDLRVAKVFNLKEKSKIKIDIQNCSGSPCMRLYNLGSELIDLPFDNFLNQGLNSQLNRLGTQKVDIPFFTLKNLKKDNKCNFDFQWDLDYQKK